jgi:lysophospholipase L1-like esterase
MSLAPAIEQINARLSELADGRHIRFVNANAKLADADGKLIDGMMGPDKLHPSVQGYQVWADALKPILAEVLGPRSAEDHAPPPTGDPSKGVQGK